MNAFEIELDGQPYAGSWRAGEYDRLTVESEFGSTYAYLDGRDPGSLAGALLVQLVRRCEQRAG